MFQKTNWNATMVLALTQLKIKKQKIAKFAEKVAQEQARLIYEPTGPYSLLLDFECSKHKIKVYKANPRDSKHFS